MSKTTDDYSIHYSMQPTDYRGRVFGRTPTQHGDAFVPLRALSTRLTRSHPLFRQSLYMSPKEKLNATSATALGEVQV